MNSLMRMPGAVHDNAGISPRQRDRQGAFKHWSGSYSPSAQFSPGVWLTISALTEVFFLAQVAECGQKGQKNKRVRERRSKSNLIPPISCRHFPCDRGGGGHRSLFKLSLR